MKCIGIFDGDKAKWGSNIWGIPILGAPLEISDKAGVFVINAIGTNSIRKSICEKFSNVSWPSLIYPNAYMHRSSRIGEGTLVFAGAVIRPDVSIGKHTIINTCASIDYDCVIGNYCHIAPGGQIAGGADLGDEILLGVGTVLIPEIHIPVKTIVGAGSTVIRSIENSGVYVGTPTKYLTRKRYDVR